MFDTIAVQTASFPVIEARTSLLADPILSSWLVAMHGRPENWSARVTCYSKQYLEMDGI